jgi:hypothetical protein
METGARVMNDIFEFWSLPWHALQRSLASGFGAGAEGGPAPGSASWNFGVAAPSAGSSWLTRPRSGMAQARQAAR